MAFLFVVHVPYTPRAEKPGFGSKKETGASGEILEPVTEEDTDNKGNTDGKTPQSKISFSFTSRQNGFFFPFYASTACTSF